MIKLSIEDFLYEVKEEMKCYEDIGEEGALLWENEFKKWLANDKIKKENVVIKKDEKFFCMDDESEVFDIVDEYLDALEQGQVKEYWKKFQ